MSETTAKANPTLLGILIVILIVMLAFLVSSTGQAVATSQEPTMPSYVVLTPEEAYDMINRQEVVIVDLRTQEKYHSGHILGALLIPLSKLESRLGELDTTDHILVYHSCSSCSKKAAQILVDNGFPQVYHLEGGIGQWQAQGFPVTQETKCSSCG